jgi:hypothetical protein
LLLFVNHKHQKKNTSASPFVISINKSNTSNNFTSFDAKVNVRRRHQTSNKKNTFTMKFNLINNAILSMLLQTSSTSAFLSSSGTLNRNPAFTSHVPSLNKYDIVQNHSTALQMSSTSSSTSSTSSSASTPRKPKKTVQDRTQAETQALIRDLIQAAIEAGPRAGPMRTMQAYSALIRTVQDFIPGPISPVNSSPLPFVSGNTNNSNASREPETFSTPLALRKLFERMGATYIKLGQFIASSPTLFPNQYVLVFQKCLDSTEPLEWNIIQKVIEKELQSNSKSSIKDVFQSIDKEPLASASIAQVHRATLKSGERVVIKVQKPNIDESLKADLSFIYVASRVLEFVQPDFERTSLSAIAGDINHLEENSSYMARVSKIQT